MRNSVTLWISEIVFGLLLTGSLFGQNANVSGQVADSQGGGVPGAAITLTNTGTNRAVQTQSNPEGYFRLPPVPPGEGLTAQHQRVYQTDHAADEDRVQAEVLKRSERQC